MTEAAKYTKKHKRRTSMSPVGFEPAIPGVKRLQNYALDHMATGIEMPSITTFGWDRVSTVIRVLCYKSEGRWFDFSLT